MRALCLGSLNLDYAYRLEHFVRPGETLPAKSFAVHAGGKGLNQAIALAKAGLEVWHAGAVGQDGDLLLAELDSYGVDTSLIQKSNEATGHAIIQITDKGENSIIIHGGANRSLNMDYIEAVLEKFSAGDLLLLQNEINLLPEIIKEASKRKLRIAFNAAPMTSEVLDYPLHLLEWLMVNEIEGEALAKEKEPAAIVDHLKKSYPATKIVLTLGEKGAIATDQKGKISCSAYAVELVDTTAAGDCFNGYFLSSVLRGKTVKNALLHATAASAICVGRKGAAISIPEEAEVLEFVRLHPAEQLRWQVLS